MLNPLPKMPDALLDLMATIGPRWATNRTDNIQIMLNRFSEVLKAMPRDNIDVRRDIAYGPHARQQFDLYMPTGGATKGRIVLFVHGGAFMDGHRNRTDEIYSNVSYYLARNGVGAINIGYRLGNDAGFPAGSDDIASVVKWTHEHAEDIGVDRSRIFLMGHSAGAAHAGSYAYDKRRHPAGGPGLAGLIVVSGRVRAETLAENPNANKVRAYYNTDDAEILADLSPVSHIDANSIPTFIAWGEYENPLIDVHCAELAYRLADAKRRAPSVMSLRGHNHTSTIGHIGTADEKLGQAILEFIANPS